MDYQARTNGVATSYEYNGRGMISSLRHKKSANGPDLAYREYWRDERDRMTAWKRGIDSSQNGMEDGRGDRYGYDAEGQLTSASYRAENPEEGATTPSRVDIFSYDAVGNRVRSNYLASRGWLDFTRKDNGLNQYSGWWNYSGTFYDEDLGGWGIPGTANGVLMQEGWITASFNALNQPMGIWSPVYAGTGNWMWFGHDPLGRCVKRWIGPLAAATPGYNPATYYYYDGWSLIQEGSSSSASNATRLYVHGGRVDEMVAQITPGNGWQRYFQYDARGHCTLQTDASGDIVEQYDYDAFGFPYSYDRWGNNMASSPWGNRFLFTGREWISDLRTYDYRNRMYQPELGRFLQPDPKQFAAGDYNLYRYCHNDPINHTDPMGLEDENYFDNGFFGIGREVLRKWITRSPDDSRTFTIGAHGVDGGRTMWDANRKIEMTPRQLFDRTKNNPELQKAERIMLYSCQLGAGGKNSFAQEYANLTGKTVMAPTKELWVDKKGHYFSAGTLPKVDPNNPKEPPQPDYSAMGKIQIFVPSR